MKKNLLLVLCLWLLFAAQMVTASTLSVGMMETTTTETVNAEATDTTATIESESMTCDFYEDKDGDGFSVIGNTKITASCDTVITGYSKNTGDCDDDDKNVSIVQTWYADIDSDGYSSGLTLQQCNRPLGYKIASELVSLDGDCNDNNDLIKGLRNISIIRFGTLTPCKGADVVLTTGAYITGATYLWSDGSTAAGTKVAAAARIYNVTVTLGTCRQIASYAMPVIDLNAVAISTDASCRESNGSATVTATGGGDYTYLWSNGATTSAISGLSEGQYSVTVTSKGCTTTAATTVRTSNVHSNYSVSEDVQICRGETAYLNVDSEGNSSFLWSTGATTTSINVSPEKTTTYTVLCRDECKSISLQVTVWVNQQDKPYMREEIEVCKGTSVSLHVYGSGKSFLWNTGATTRSINVSPEITTSYTVLVKGNNECINDTAIAVKVEVFDCRSDCGIPFNDPIVYNECSQLYPFASIWIDKKYRGYTVEWFAEGKSFCTGKVAKYLQNGVKYTVRVTKEQCVSEKSFIFVDKCIRNVTTATATLYPNPTTDWLQLNIPERLQNASISIVDIQGKPLGVYPVGTTSINVSGFMPETYVLYLTNQNEHIALRFVKY